MSLKRALHTAYAATLFIVLAGCASSTDTPLKAENQKRVDFSGHWELDYGQSDNIQARLNALVRELRRQAERVPLGRLGQRRHRRLLSDHLHAVRLDRRPLRGG